MASNHIKSSNQSTLLPRPPRLLIFALLFASCHAIRRLPNELYANKTSANRMLKMSPVDVPIPESPDDHLVSDLPFLPDEKFLTAHWAGLLPANDKQTKYFFYWLFKYDEDDAPPVQHETDIPLLLWLNGGPGCSSMDGLFLEHGPFRLDTTEEGEWTMRIHSKSWHTAPAYVVYVDQPVGTGLSFTTSGEYPSNDEQVNRDFHHWLQEFLLLHAHIFLNDDKTELKRPLYFSGESHAGHYIPSMMQYIHDHNDSSQLKIRVSGAAIGNGWTDPYHQYAGAEAAYGHGLIDLAQKYALDEKEKACQAQLSAQNYHYGGCLGLLDDIVAESEGTTGKYRISQYDARKWEQKHAARSFPPGHKRVESYLGGWDVPSGDPEMNVRSQVLEAIHATPSQTAGQRYKECTDPPYNALAHQDGLGVVNEVVQLLEDDVKMLFFNGLEDLICNHVGNEVMLMKLPWKHREHWVEAKRYSWTANDESEVSGYVKEFENLIFLKVLHSGHMVPMDVPNVALDMMRIFMYGKSFESSEQGLDRAQEEPSAECPDCPACPAEPSRTSSATTTPTTDDDAEIENSNSVMKYVVEHSWIGAILAVTAFLGTFLYVKRRQQRTPVIVSSYGNLEMKEERRYHDRLEDDSSLDEDELESNGNGII